MDLQFFRVKWCDRYGQYCSQIMTAYSKHHAETLVFEAYSDAGIGEIKVRELAPNYLEDFDVPISNAHS